MGTFTATGTGGIIEGNLGAANVDVNLDSALSFDGTDDYVKIAGHADLDFGTGDFTIAGWIKGWATGGSAMYLFDNRESGNVNEPAIYFSSPNVYYYANDTGIADAALPCSADDWNHIAVARISGTSKLYINGVEKDSASDGTDYDASGNTIGVNLGRRYNGANSLNGNIADFRIYKGEGLSAANIAILASKINGDSSLGAGTTNLKVWLKLNEGTGTAIDNAQGTAATDGVAVGSPAWAFDAFYVNVHDNSTTTDGTFTVTQGKVEGLSLSSVDLNGSSEYISASDAAGLSFGDGSDDSPFSISAWIRVDANNFPIISKGHYNSGVGEYAFTINSSGHLAFELYDESVSSCYVGQKYTTAFTLNQWVHVTGTYSAPAGGGAGATDGVKLYIDGVLVSSDDYEGNAASYDAMENLSSDFWIGRLDNTYADGEIRDVRIYDYELSADQASSLYSGSYNVTPLYWWKIDEGHTTEGTVDASGAFEDSGTGTDADGTGTNLDADSCVNGTLDLDGTLRIQANGTLSAPRGLLTLSGGSDAFHSNATNPTVQFIHNDGTVEFDGTNNRLYAGTGTATGTHFHNLTHDSSGYLDTYEHYTVENKLTTKAGQTYYQNSNTDIFIGKVGTNGELEVNGTWQFSSGTGTSKITGANTNAGGAALIDWNGTMDNGGVKTIELDNVNVDGTFTTAGSSDITFQLTGDCEFDAVTVSSGDTLDLNGQRAEFGGAFVLAGALDWASSMPVFKHTVDLAGKFPTSNAATTIIHNPPSASEKTWISCYSDGTFFAQGAETEITGYGWSSGTPAYVLDKVVVGGMLDAQQHLQSGGDVTVATGGELRGNDRTVTVAGDFTTSGGLLGASCLKFPTSTNTDKTVEIPISASANDHIKGAFSDGIFTLESWIKLDSNFDNGVLWHKENEFSLHVSRGSATDWAIADGASWNYGANGFTMPNLEDGKWHHLAFSRRNEAGNQGYYDIYVDGKLVQTHKVASTGLWTANDNNVFVGSYNGTGSSWIEKCHVENFRIWGTARTAVQIRADMFKSTPTTSATDNIANFTFNEGTGTAITASDPNSASSNETAGTWNGDWADAGTFTYGTSTLVMSGDGTMNIPAGFDVYNLTGGASSKTTTIALPSNGSDLDVYGTLTVDSGTLTDTNNADVIIRGTAPPVVNGSSTLENLWRIQNISNMTLPATTYNILLVTSSSTCTSGGNMTINAELEVASGSTFNANGNTATVKKVDINNGTLNLGNSTMTFTSVLADAWNMTSASSLLTGNTTINGYLTSDHTPITLPEAGGFEVVGDIKWLKAASGTDLTVVGSVTDCSFADSTANIRQFFHTLDTQQLLDADEAGDDDLKLTRPSLDNAHELQTRG